MATDILRETDADPAPTLPIQGPPPQAQQTRDFGYEYWVAHNTTAGKFGKKFHQPYAQFQAGGFKGQKETGFGMSPQGRAMYDALPQTERDQWNARGAKAYSSDTGTGTAGALPIKPGQPSAWAQATAKRQAGEMKAKQAAGSKAVAAVNARNADPATYVAAQQRGRVADLAQSGIIDAGGGQRVLQNKYGSGAATTAPAGTKVTGKVFDERGQVDLAASRRAEKGGFDPETGRRGYAQNVIDPATGKAQGMLDSQGLPVTGRENRQNIASQQNAIMEGAGDRRATDTQAAIAALPLSKPYNDIVESTKRSRNLIPSNTNDARTVSVTGAGADAARIAAKPTTASPYDVQVSAGAPAYGGSGSELTTAPLPVQPTPAPRPALTTAAAPSPIQQTQEAAAWDTSMSGGIESTRGAAPIAKQGSMPPIGSAGSEVSQPNPLLPPATVTNPITDSNRAMAMALDAAKNAQIPKRGTGGMSLAGMGGMHMAVVGDDPKGKKRENQELVQSATPIRVTPLKKFGNGGVTSPLPQLTMPSQQMPMPPRIMQPKPLLFA